ncbi:MAG: polysaccharide biosynthesis tyrosine autokinase [Candidatus Nanopelagicales bacterium]
MNSRDFARLIRKQWLLVAVTTALVAGVTALLSILATPVYTAKSSVFVALPSGNTASELFQGSTYAQGQMQSFAELATRPVVLNEVIDDLGLDTTSTALARRVTARVSGDTVILEVWAADTSPEDAAEIANSVVKNLNTAAGDVSPKRDDGEPTVEMTTLGEATAPLYPSAPNKRRNVALGVMAGLLLGVAAALAREKADKRLRSVEDVASRTTAPILEELPEDSNMRAGLVVMRDKPVGPLAESFRRLRANLEFLRVGGQPIALAVSSAEPGEGKSSIAINLAVASAKGGDRTLLIDADMRKPVIAERLGLDDTHGLSTVLSGQVRFADAVQRGGRGVGIDVLVAGPVPPNAVDLLSSAGMKNLLATLLTEYDVVLLDTPPIMPVVDAAVLGRLVSGTIIVVRLNVAKKASLIRSLGSLEGADAPVLGVVVNSAPKSQVSGYYQYGSQPRAEQPDDVDPGMATSRASQTPAV